MAKSTERQKCLEAEMARIGLPFEYVFGVDGSLLSSPQHYQNLREEFSEYLPEKFESISLLPGEIGCYLAFIRALRKAKEQRLENLLIVEDDVKFSFDNAEILQDLTQIDLSWDQLKLTYTSYPLNRGIWVGNRVIREQKFSFYFYWRGIIGTTCNLYSAAAVEKLLKSCPRFGLQKPIDALISTRRHQIDFLPIFVRPELAKEELAHPSSIISHRGNRDALQHYLHKQKFSQRKLRQLKYIAQDLRHPVRSFINWVKKISFVWFCLKYLLWRRLKSQPPSSGNS